MRFVTVKEQAIAKQIACGMDVVKNHRFLPSFEPSKVETEFELDLENGWFNGAFLQPEWPRSVKLGQELSFRNARDVPSKGCVFETDGRCHEGGYAKHSETARVAKIKIERSGSC